MLRGCLWLLAILVCLFLVAPTFVVVPLSLSTSEFLMFPPPGYSFQWYAAFFADPTWTEALLRSIAVAFGAMAIAVSFGTAAAYGLVRGRPGFAPIAEPAFVFPMIVPTVVFAVAAYLIAIRLGLTGQLWLISLAHGILTMPFVILNVSASLRTSDPRLELAAQSLGAGYLRAYATTTLRLTMPAVAGSALLSMILSLDEVVVALFLSPDTQPTLPVRMYSSIRFELDPLVPVASTIMILGTLLLGLVYLCLRFTLARRPKRPA